MSNDAPNITPATMPPDLREKGVRVVGMDRTAAGVYAMETYHMPDGRVFVTRVMRAVNGGRAK